MPRPNSGPRLKLRRQKGAQDIWEIVWYEHGGRRTKSTGTGSRQEAERALASFLLERDAKTSIGDPAQRWVSDVLTLYATEHAPTTSDPARISYAIEALVEYWGDKRVGDVSRVTCREYCEKRGVEDGTLRRELGVLRAAINHDHQEGRLTHSVSVWMPEKPDGKERWLTRSEAARLLWAARNVPKSRMHLPLYILLGLYTGARKQAILELRWSQVDMENGVIDYHVPGSRRTKKRRARIPIPRQLMHALRRAKRRSNGTGTVIEYHGEPVGDIKKSFSSAASAADFEEVTPHTLRHTAITWLVQKGVKLWEVSGYVGASVETIQRTYGHHAPDYLENARKAME